MKRIILISILIVLSFLSLSGCWITTRNASQIGYITNVETNGLIFKSSCVYLRTSLESSKEETWCVEDGNVRKQLENARDKQIKIKINYHDEFFYMPGRCGCSQAQVGIDGETENSYGMIDSINEIG
jgi:hypothetical protein